MFARQAERGRAPGAVRGGIARDRRSVLFGGARRRRLLAALLALTLVALATAAIVLARPAAARTAPPMATTGATPPPPTDDGRGADVTYPVIAWRRSQALGTPDHGRLVRGVQLPAAGPDWFTWDPVLNRTPDRGWRRWGTDALLRTVLAVLREYRTAHPAAPRVGIMDIARQHGGWFGREFGGLGHASHQNGLDIDIMYPRSDERERRPLHPRQVDQARAQDLVDRFVAAGADKIFVGPHLSLRGPTDVVQKLVYHDDHMHVRIFPPPD
jgi:murein endopeptidase